MTCCERAEVVGGLVVILGDGGCGGFEVIFAGDLSTGHMRLGSAGPLYR